MLTWFVDHLLEILFGLIAAVTSVIAIYYARKTYELERGTVLADPQRSVHVYLTREAMIDALLRMYDRAEPDDVIWAQTVSMRNYPGDVGGKILKAAGNNVRFQMILNTNSPALREFTKLFAPVKQAQLVESSDNVVRVQGLSDKEVILAFPTLTTYTALRVTDQHFVRLVHGWFEDRFQSLLLGRSPSSENSQQQDTP